MKQKSVAILLCVVMLFGLMPAVSFAAGDTTIFITAEDFGKNVGTWTMANRDAGAFSYVLRAMGGGKPASSKNAEIHIEVPADGEYTVWARTRDYKAGVDKNGKEIKSGDRLCKVQVGGTLLENELGKHGKDGFEWEKAGTVSLKKGETAIELVDTSANYARVEALALSTNPSLSLPTGAGMLDDAHKQYAPKIVEFTSGNGSESKGETVVNANLPKGEKPAKVSTFFLGAEAFDGHLGTWLSPGKDGSTLPVLRSPGGQKPQDAKNAISAFEATEAGTYYVWAWTRDYGDGVRTYKIAVGGNLTDRVLGAHGVNGWAWEYCGMVELEPGQVQVEVVDSSNNYGRLQGIVVTNDPTYIPEESASVASNAVKANPSASYTSSITGVIADPNAPAAEFELKENEAYIVVTAKDFNTSNLGSWKLSPVAMSSILSEIVMSASDAKDHTSDPATMSVIVPKTGVYKVLVHSNDAPNNSGRRFMVQVGGASSREFGQHGKGWGWESMTVPLVAGENQIKIMDHTGNYGRFDMIVITSDLGFEMTDTRGNLNALLELSQNRPTTFETIKDPARPADEIAVSLNGEYLKFDVPPVLINDRTMVPFRAIFEAMSCAVDWDDATQTATGTRNGKVIKLTIDSTEAKVDNQKFLLDSPATLVNDRTLVPLRFISEALGADVAWEDPTQTVFIVGEIPPQMIMLTPESYYDTGTWDLEGVVSGSFDCGSMRGAVPAKDDATPADGDPSKTKPAKANIQVAKDGTYKVFAHCRDYTTSFPSQRTFAVAIDGKQVGGNLGTHGKNGFYWQEAGTIDLKAGEHVLDLMDTSGFYARCDMVILTDDLDYEPSSLYSEMLALSAPVKASDVENPVYPAYAKEMGAVTDEVTIENGQTRVKFYKVNTSNGQVVQNEIYNMHNGQWVQTNKRDEEIGFMVLRADAASLGASPQDQYVFSASYSVNGRPASYMGTDLFRAGLGTWFIPTDYEVVSDKAVKLTAANDVGAITATWEIADETAAPKVTVTGTFNQEGFYTIGALEGDEMAFEEFDFALAPFRVQGKRIPDEISVFSEQYLFTPMGCYTLPANNEYGAEKVTKGVVVDPAFTQIKWVRRSDAGYGISMKGPDNGYRGSVYAPILGSADSKIAAGGSYTYSYRVISSVSDWYDNYKFIAQDLYGVDSYRQNTYATLNQAIFNTRKYSMNADFSGWDPIDKSYWNIESQNTTSVADPMQALQTYLLTEDENYLEQRTIPTIANFMTRGALHFNGKYQEKDTGYVKVADVPRPVGNFIACLNMNVKGGMYELTRGRVPYMLEQGLEQTLAGKNVNGYSSMTPFSDDLYLYKYTGDRKYLESAMVSADKYLTDVVYAPQTKPVDFASFVYISYYPNIPALLDLYEASGEQKYLDAAHYSAQWLVTTLWVPGVDGDKKHQTVVANANIDSSYSGFHDWYGASYRHLGEGDTTDYTENVENWIVSRVGLGLEQASTFYGKGSSTNMIMSMWVGDLLRIAAYTGDEYLANAAENAVVGRFSNYPGYYYGYYGFTNTQMKEDYPYKGPDATAIYYHHIPPFMAMLEDFIINQSFYRSNGKISFPNVRQSGYAYFTSNHYGFEAGNMYDLSDMWLWIDEGVLDSGNLQIDWVGARKDGMVAFAMMNQSAEAVTTTATLGEKVGAVTGKATLYDKDGNKSEIDVVDGKFTVTVPAKGIATVAIAAEGVKAPSYTAFDYNLSGTEVDTASTYYDHGNGKAVILQMTPENYYAYVYVTDKPATVKEVKMTYTVGGKTETLSTTTYPFEFIVKVSDPTQAFSYELELVGTDGTAKKVSGSTIKPL